MSAYVFFSFEDKKWVHMLEYYLKGLAIMMMMYQKVWCGVWLLHHFKNRSKFEDDSDNGFIFLCFGKLKIKLLHLLLKILLKICQGKSVRKWHVILILNF